MLMGIGFSATLLIENYKLCHKDVKQEAGGVLFQSCCWKGNMENNEKNFLASLI